MEHVTGAIKDLPIEAVIFKSDTGPFSKAVHLNSIMCSSPWRNLETERAVVSEDEWCEIAFLLVWVLLGHLGPGVARRKSARRGQEKRGLTRTVKRIQVPIPIAVVKGDDTNNT